MQIFNRTWVCTIIFLLTTLLSACKEIAPADPGGDGGDINLNLGTGGGHDDADGDDDGGVIPGDGNGGDNDKGTITKFKPAMAVRATGCILCHAQVKSNIITDFGYKGDGAGTDYYFGKGGAGLSATSGSIYGDHSENWLTAKIWGQVIVPETVPTKLYGTSVTKTLSEYVSAVVTAPDSKTPKPEVTAVTKVYIAAPTQAKIRGLVTGLPTVGVGWQYLPTQTIGYTNLEGFEKDSTNQWLMNSPDTDLRCDGDLVVEGQVVLKNLRLQTVRGCRIYATGMVHIQGPITYVGNPVDGNLQITSARAVMLGMGAGPVLMNGSNRDNSLAHRFQDMWTRPGYFTRESGLTTQQKLDRLVNESYLITGLVDAALQPTGRQVGFDRLLVNAPTIQSRYQGHFNGVIIAEVALFSLNQFDFKFDEVFSRVPVLPLIPEKEFLEVVE